MSKQQHKSGFVNIIGSPNVGKSTLMNALTGEKLSIITSKAQTTRHRILGIVNGENFQIVYSDTPGILKPDYKLHESMMRFVDSAIKDADVFLFVTDVYEREANHPETLEKIKKSKIPTIVLVNKIDLGGQEKVAEAVDYWRKHLFHADVTAISALHQFNLEIVFDKILELLPESPAYFPGDELSDRPMRFFMAEIIREKIFKNYHEEIPYSVEIVVNQFLDQDKLVKIQAEIMVSRDSQKGILIGHQGKMLKRIGTQAREDMEEFLDKKVFLQLFVKVDKNWRNKEDKLKQYGYQ